MIRKRLPRWMLTIIGKVVVFVNTHYLDEHSGCPNCGLLLVTKPEYDLCPFCGWGPETEPDKSGALARKEFTEAVLSRNKPHPSPKNDS